MSKLVVLASLSVTACATSGLGTIDRDTAAHAKVQLQVGGAEGTRASFPQAIEPALPRVDRLAHQVRARFGDAAVAAVNLCVSPAGHVTRVALAGESTFRGFDQALVRDVEGWQFAPMPGPATLEICDRATISYRAPR